jgi:hypothetical protein
MHRCCSSGDDAVSELILPDDINKVTAQLASDIALAWVMLERACLIKQIPIEMAEAQVKRYIDIAMLGEIEAIHKVFMEITHT